MGSYKLVELYDMGNLVKLYIISYNYGHTSVELHAVASCSPSDDACNSGNLIEYILCVYASVYMHVCVYVCVRVRVRVCVCVCVYLFLNTIFS